MGALKRLVDGGFDQTSVEGPAVIVNCAEGMPSPGPCSLELANWNRVMAVK